MWLSMYHRLKHTKTMHSAHRAYLCVSNGSEKAHFPLNNINRLISVIETYCASCEIQTEIVYIN
jgi:hypothetical protein